MGAVDTDVHAGAAGINSITYGDLVANLEDNTTQLAAAALGASCRLQQLRDHEEEEEQGGKPMWWWRRSHGLGSGLTKKTGIRVFLGLRAKGA